MTKYEDLALIPLIVAETVANRPYTGIEWSDKVRSQTDVKEIESRRQKLTQEEITRFAERFDALCKIAYQARARWFMKCVNSKSNVGRDQLYMWATHWLVVMLHCQPQIAAYLKSVER